jgi:hypothetical protein
VEESTVAEASLAQKLRIKPGQKLLILNAPDGYMRLLGSLPQGTDVKTSTDGTFDFVQIFVRNKAEVDSSAKAAVKALKPGGMLWFTYPKKSSKIKTDISRDTGWEAVRGLGMEGVFLISVDDTWSAMRYRPASDVKSSKKS